MPVRSAFFAEGESAGAAKHLMSCIRSVCADMGTEMSVPDIAGCNSGDYLLHWMNESTGLELEPELRYCGATVPDACEDEFLMPNALLSAGLVHILHNLSMEVDAALPWWPDWLEGFRCLTHLLHKSHLRQRFVARCLLGTKHERFAPLFESGVHYVAKWRWGALNNALAKLLPLRAALI